MPIGFPKRSPGTTPSGIRWTTLVRVRHRSRAQRLRLRNGHDEERHPGWSRVPDGQRRLHLFTGVLKGLDRSLLFFVVHDSFFRSSGALKMVEHGSTPKQKLVD